MKQITRWLLALLGGLIISGCTIISELPEETEPTTVEYQKARELLLAFILNQPEKFNSLLPEEKLKNFNFIVYRYQIVDSLGEPTGFRYLTTIDMPVFTPYVWKISFERRNKEGEKIKGEALFRVIVGKVQDEILIVGFQFL